MEWFGADQSATVTMGACDGKMGIISALLDTNIVTIALCHEESSFSVYMVFGAALRCEDTGVCQTAPPAVHRVPLRMAVPM